MLLKYKSVLFFENILYSLISVFVLGVERIWGMFEGLKNNNKKNHHHEKKKKSFNEIVKLKIAWIKAKSMIRNRQYKKNIARLQEASLSTFHQLVRCQVDLTKRIFWILINKKKFFRI